MKKVLTNFFFLFFMLKLLTRDTVYCFFLFFVFKRYEISSSQFTFPLRSRVSTAMRTKIKLLSVMDPHMFPFLQHHLLNRTILAFKPKANHAWLTLRGLMVLTPSKSLSKGSEILIDADRIVSSPKIPLLFNQVFGSNFFCLV